MPDKILVVDDEKSVRDLLQRYLSKEGYQVTLARSGNEAIEKSRREAFNMLIVDMRLPDMEGTEVVRKIKQIDPETDVIVLTAFPSLESSLEALKLKVADYVLKPVGDWKEIIFSIERALHQQRQKRLEQETLGELKKENQKLKSSLSQELERINQVSRSMSSVFDQQQILTILTLTLKNAIDCELCGVLLFSKEKAQLLIQAPQSLSDTTKSKFRDLFIRDVRNFMGFRLEPERVPIETLPSVETFNFPRGLNGEILSFSSCPIVIRGKNIGILGIGSFLQEAFGENDMRALSIFSNQAATALENAHLYQEMSLRMNELTAFFEVSKSIVSTLDFDPLIKMVVEKVSQIMKADVCLLWLLDRTRGELTLRAWQGISPEGAGDLKPANLKVGEGILGKVVREKRVMAVSDINKESGTAIPDFIRKTGMASLLCLPLVFKERVVGVVSIHSRLIREFTAEEIRFYSTLSEQMAIAITNAQLYEHLQVLYMGTISALAAALEAKDRYTQGHSERVTKYASNIARVLGLNHSQLRPLVYACRLHDIGKIAIPDYVLNKPGKLSQEEWDLMRKHPVTGAAILERLEFLNGVTPLVRHHHERCDGSGYPDGLRLEDIAFGARIISVADAFDAMTSARSYRPAKNVKEAIHELKNNEGNQFDPEVVNAFLSWWDNATRVEEKVDIEDGE